MTDNRKRAEEIFNRNFNPLGPTAMVLEDFYTDIAKSLNEAEARGVTKGLDSAAYIADRHIQYHGQCKACGGEAEAIRNQILFLKKDGGK